jgi:hypothetical protein
VVYRIRLIEPILADFAVLVGDAIRNLRSSHDQVAYLAGRAALWSAHRGCRANDEGTDPHLRRAVRRLATSKNKQTKLRRLEIFGKRGSGRFARDSRSRAAEAISRRSMGGRRWQIAGG